MTEHDARTTIPRRRRCAVAAWLLAAACAAACAAATAQDAPEGVLVDGCAAIVDGELITVGEVLELIRPVENELRQAYSGQELLARVKNAYKTMLDGLVEQKLIVGEFKKSGREMPERVVSSRFNEILSDRFQGDYAALQEALSAENMTIEEWRESIHDRLIIRALRSQEVNQKVSVTPTGIRAYYEENVDKYRTPAKVQLSMIILERGEDDAALAVKRRQANDIRKKLLAGAEFAAMARDLSIGSKARDGGSWGWVELTQLREELASVAAALRPGELSPVILAGENLYLLLVEGRQAGAITPLAKVYDDIERTLRREQAAALYAKWIERLKQKASIKICENE